MSSGTPAGAGIGIQLSDGSQHRASSALRIFDHYHFRVLQHAATKTKKPLVLARPPRHAGEAPWWQEDYTDARKVRDRELFA
jgi:hypothetical protein